jgi:catechol 2,3-dioxygenase-like lactoylglutathione lyase family enzyme
MKRFHLHMNVADLAANIGFYSKLFGAEPTRVETDYAKWMLEDPPVNFAISTRGGKQGVDHLGFQTDDPAELVAMKQSAQAADLALRDDGEGTCCYARSDKHWITDPQGVAWEQFHTLANIPVFSEPAAGTSAKACCAKPAAEAKPATAGACC